MTEAQTQESLIKFPCDFMLKIMGKAEDDFEAMVIAIVKAHFPNLSDANIQKKFSKDNQFLSLSVTVHADSKPALDALYRDLSGNKKILMVL
ncbi:MAG: DUF493 domain-containing protein [Coxiellaceae bacterium]|nr:DUF493 domain-containing protein [Coxiellaceae bacterium]